MIKKILNIFIKSKNNSINLDNIYADDYEKRLSKVCGKCNFINSSIKLLVIADTHNTLCEEEFKNYIYSNNNFDLCVLLGDHSNGDIDIILKYIDKSKIVGILGNHDYDYLSLNKIKNINGKIITVNNLKILGMEGSFRYKPVSFPSFTQEESIEFFDKFDGVDILVSHDKKFDPTRLKDPAHEGLIGITNYIYKKRIPIHIHGHIHEEYEIELLNGTKEISVLGYKIIEIKRNNSL